MTYLAPIPKDQITTQDREFSQDRTLMRVTPDDRISIREKAQGIAKSGLYKDVNTPEKAMCIMLMGRSLGVNELTALQGIYIINGRPWVSADLILALVRAKKICKDMEAETSLAGAMCKMSRKDDGFTFTARFGPEEAKRAGLTGKETYQKYPEQMYLHRAVRRCCTMVCPEVLMGIGVDEEGYSTNEEMNGPEGEEIAKQLADGEAQLERDRRAYLAKTRMPSNEELIANNLELEKKRKASADVFDTPAPEFIAGDNLEQATALHKKIQDYGRNGEKFTAYLQKNFGAETIDGVAASDGNRLVANLQNIVERIEQEEADKAGAFNEEPKTEEPPTDAPATGQSLLMDAIAACEGLLNKKEIGDALELYGSRVAGKVPEEKAAEAAEYLTKKANAKRFA